MNIKQNLDLTFKCACCGKIYTLNDHYCFIVEGDTICEDCINDGHYGRCKDCGKWYHDSLMSYCDEDDNYYCDDCYKKIINKRVTLLE